MASFRLQLLPTVLAAMCTMPGLSSASTVVDIFEATYALESAVLFDADMDYDEDLITLPRELGCDDGFCLGFFDVLDPRWPAEFKIDLPTFSEPLPIDQLFASSITLKAEFLDGELISCSGLDYNIQFPGQNGCNFGKILSTNVSPGEDFNILRSTEFEEARISDNEFRILTDYEVEFIFGPGFGSGSANFGLDPTYVATETSWSSFETSGEVGLVPIPSTASLALGGLLSLAMVRSLSRRKLSKR